MNATLHKFVKRSHTAVREAKLSYRHQGNADLEGLMNRVTECANRVNKLASRGPGFDEERTEALEAIWDNLLELQEMSLNGTDQIWSDLPPGEVLPINEAILREEQ